MSTILRHVVWPNCEFKMHVWNVLHAARWKYRTQKIAKNSPSGHHRTTLSGYTFANKAWIDNRKKIVKQQYLPHMCSQYGELLPNNGWELLTSLGNPANFNGFRVLAALLHGTTVVSVSQTLRRWIEGASYILYVNIMIRQSFRMLHYSTLQLILFMLRCVALCYITLHEDRK